MAVTGAIAAVAGLASATYSGYKQQEAAKEGMKQQERAQRESLAAAAMQQRKASLLERKANARKPNIESMLGDRRTSGGAGSMMFSGPSGATKLGQTSTLGG
jgi:uncharacterized protein HemX